MALELWTRTKLLISVLNYINSLATVVYTTSFLQRFPSQRVVTLNLMLNTRWAIRRCVRETTPTLAQTRKLRTQPVDMRIKAVKRFQCILWCQTSNKRRRRMRRVKQHHKSDCCFLQHTSHINTAWLRVGASENTICFQTNGRDITVSFYLSLVTSHFASDLFS